MGLIKAYRKKHWVVALDADLVNIPNPQLGDSALTEDKNKLYYWEGGAWKTGLGYEFVPRAANVADKQVGDFITDGTWKVNGLNLSGIVPVGAIAVLIKLDLIDDAANNQFTMRQDAAKGKNAIENKTQVANIPLSLVEIVGIESDRLLDYFGSNVAFVAIDVTVLGWFI